MLTQRIDDESSVTGVEPRGKDVRDDEFGGVDPGQNVDGHPDNDRQEDCKVTDDMTNLGERERGNGKREERERER